MVAESRRWNSVLASVRPWKWGDVLRFTGFDETMKYVHDFLVKEKPFDVSTAVMHWNTT